MEEIEKVAASSQYEGIVVVDEAYVDFSDKGSAVSLIERYPNIVVLQTLSKAFGLAGIRCGFALGAPDVIQLMNNVKAPYNVNSLTSEVAINALKSIETLEKNIASILEQRVVVSEKLSALDFVVEVFPSDSNFLLFRVQGKAKELYKTVRYTMHERLPRFRTLWKNQCSASSITSSTSHTISSLYLNVQMADNGVVCRFRGSEMHCTECLRVTIGKAEENEKFMELLVKTWNDCK